MAQIIYSIHLSFTNPVPYVFPLIEKPTKRKYEQLVILNEY